MGRVRVRLLPDSIIIMESNHSPFSHVAYLFQDNEFYMEAVLIYKFYIFHPSSLLIHFCKYILKKNNNKFVDLAAV